MAYFTYCGYKVYYRYGSAVSGQDSDTVLILADADNNKLLRENVYYELSARYGDETDYDRLIIDFLGKGDSDNGGWVSDEIGDRVSQIIELMYELDIKSVIVLCLDDDNAEVAIELAKRCREKVKRLVVCEKFRLCIEGAKSASARNEEVKHAGDEVSDIDEPDADLVFYEKSEYLTERGYLRNLIENGNDASSACPYCGKPMETGKIEGFREPASWVKGDEWSDEAIKLTDEVPSTKAEYIKSLFITEKGCSAYLCRECGKIVIDVHKQLGKRSFSQLKGGFFNFSGEKE